jgi:hypothetical protein
VLLADARRRLRATRIRSASLPDPATSFSNSSYFRPVSPKETRVHKWDQEFESALLQRRVRCEPDFLRWSAPKYGLADREFVEAWMIRR